MTEQQFTTLYKEHRPILAAFARRYASENADDLLQDALVAAWRFRDKFEVGTNFGAWMTTIIRRLHFNEYRRIQLRGGHDVSYSASDFILNVGAVPPKEIEGLSDDMLTALDKLDPEFRAMILMKCIEDVPYSEIAAHFETQEGTVKSRIFAAKNIMAPHLLHYAEGHGIKVKRKNSKLALQ